MSEQNSGRISAREAAILVGVHESTLHRWRKNAPPGPALAFSKIGSRYYYERIDVGLFLARCAKPEPE